MKMAMQSRMKYIRSLVLFVVVIFVTQYITTALNTNKKRNIETLHVQQKHLSSLIEAKRRARDETCGVMLNVITTFPMLKSTYDMKSHGFFKESHEKFESRQMDFVHSLALNMKHPCVEKIHLLVENMDLESYLKSMNTTLFSAPDINTMVHFHKVRSFPTYKDYAKYANEHLMSKNIAVMNADISLGDGFDRIKESYLIDRQVAYCLTRHSSLLPNCTFNRNFCSRHYFGSHDVHIMFMKEAFDNWSLDFLDFPINLLGVENLLMYIITAKLNKTGLNPCSILKSHHNHCSGLRTVDTVNKSKRINIGPNANYSTRISFSKRLF
ncbi:unnamed protein product [Owenia fusiformis]|uniref:Uncharacterized protein n=1 Tax=Owenia fusiformis TaxID=6347 RepID=A0A8J1U1S5_OWEFU|nr:unnamed protein product [Owenia fusiformis]